MEKIKKLFRSLKISKKRAIKPPKPERPLELYEIPLPGPPQIFKLNVDCLDEIFDYLSLTDLIHFGQTCKTMQCIAGQYFKDNYKSTKIIFDGYGIHIEYDYNKDGTKLSFLIKSFEINRYITYMVRKLKSIKPLCYFRLNSYEFASLSHICLESHIIYRKEYMSWKKILHQLEVIKLLNCSVQGDLHDMMLKYCVNLRKLFVQLDDYAPFPIIKQQTNSWLLQKYPLLEMIKLTQRNPFRMNELSTMLEMNPSIRTFSTTSGYLWLNRQDLLKCNATLNKLEIDDFYGNLSNLQELCTLLNQLHERGFYKKLHFSCFNLDEDDYMQLVALESISVKYFQATNLCQLTQLKELSIWKDDNDLNSEMDLVATSLVNLKQVFINNALLDDILIFIQYSVRLNKLRVQFADGQEALNIEKLNVERKKVANACKLTIYVPIEIFLLTKWAAKNGDLNLSRIEIRRADWYGMDYYNELII